VDRSQIHTPTRTTVKIYITNDNELFDKNKITKTQLIKIILAYSAIKIRANPRLPYSILKPDTSSDSPSAKSKGVRLVSATQEINQIPIRGTKTIILIQILFMVVEQYKVREILSEKKKIKISARLTSYETV